MSVTRTPAHALRIAILLGAILSLLLAPLRGAASCPEPAPMDCGGCCETMTCCIEAPEQQAPPAIPPVGQQSGSDLSIALMAANRPLLGLLPAGRQDFTSTASAPLGRSRDSLALLCIRLI